MTTQFDNIHHGQSTQLGKFRIADSGCAWMNNETKEITAISAAEIKWAQWLRVARNFRLRVGTRDRREVFDGFLREDHDKLSELLRKHFSVILENKEIMLKGWNWGATDFQGQELAFLVSNKTVFEIPLATVANSNIAGKTEVSLEFNPASAKPVRGAIDELTEIRFYVPGTHAKDVNSDGEKSDAEELEDISAAQALHDGIKERAEIGEVAGNMIINFEEVLILTPRGRYDVDMFPDFLRLRGRTYDYKINYAGISKLFLLPKDDQHILFILSLQNPIRQGQTRYQFLVMQFDREEEITAELNLDEEEVAKYEKLQKHYESLTYEVISGVFRALSRNKIISSGSFTSRTGHPGIKANLKAVQGDLFLLEKYIFFVSKSPLLIEMSNIHQVVFSRIGAMSSARTFDIEIVTKEGPEHTFSSINKEEHEGVESYLKSKKVRVKNQMNEDLGPPALDDDDDDEMQSVASSGEEVTKPRAAIDDEDSEDDEDFQASSSDEGSPTDTSDSDSDAAEVASDASGDREMIAPKAKKKKVATEGDKEKPKKKAAPKKDSKGSDDEAMDIDDEKPQRKPKPKAGTGKASEEEVEPVKKKQKKE